MDTMRFESALRRCARVACALACASLAGAAEAALSAKSYVQEGLIGQLDGLDNAGTGTHDASATVWKDLAGTIGDFTLNTSVAAFTGGNALKKNASGYMAQNPKRSSAIRTIETAVSGVPAEGWVLAVFAGSSQYVSFSDNKVAGCRTYFTDSNKYGVSTTVKPDPLTAAATFRSAADGLRVYQNGVQATGNSHQNYWGDSGKNEIALGGRTDKGGVELAVTGYALHAVRFYNRPLTADEVAANALVDAVRYRGAAESDLDAALKPYGFRLAADGTLHRRAVLKCCTATGHTDGTFTVYGQLRGHQEGSTVVTLLWGTSAEALANEVAVKTLDVTARPPTFSKSVQATAGGTVYWKLRAVNTQGSETFTSETDVASVRCAFLPETLATPTLTIDVPKGVTTNLYTYLEAEGKAAPSGAGSIVKTGAGTLLVTNSVLRDFAGDVYICAGGMIKVETPSPFGTNTTGGVYVEKGAMLYHHWPTWAASAPTFGKKPVYIEGTGMSDNGALYCRSDYSKNGQDIGEPGVVHLVGDARVEYNAGQQTYMKGSVYLHGHTWLVKPGVDWDYPSQSVYDETGAGHIYMVSSALFNTISFAFGDPDNFFTIASGALRANGYQMVKPFTLVLKTGVKLCMGRDTSLWCGPVYLEAGDHAFTRQFDNWPSWKLTGIVSGPGLFGSSGEGHTILGLRLDNAYNAFTGGVYLNTREFLNIGINGSLPKDGGKLTCVNSRVDFNTAGPYELPEALFSATGLVQNVSASVRATGAWKTVTKEKAGLLVYNASVGAPVLNVTGGTFRYPEAGGSVTAPVFDAITVASGATLDANGNALAVATLGGAGTVQGSVTLSEGFAVGASASVTVRADALAFGAEAKVLLADPAALARGTVYTLATATGGITPARLRTNSKNWFAVVEDNALKLYASSGTSLIVR